MEKTPQTINDRIILSADAALKKRIEEAFSPAFKIAAEGCSDLYGFEMCEVGSTGRKNGYGILENMKAHVFSNLVARERQKAIDAFMDKVESLSTEIEELRNSIPQ